MTTTPTSGQTSPEETSSDSRIGLILLVLAALIAVGAVGYRIWSNQDGAAELASADGPPDGSQSAQSVDEVIANLEAQLQDDPDNAEAWRMLGWAYLENRNPGEAVMAMRRAVTLQPENAEYHAMLGEALVLASTNSETFPDDALAAFNQALAIDPDNAPARYFIGVSKDMAGDHEAALDDWFALMQDTPSDAPYATQIRSVIEAVGEANDIDVSARLASTSFAPAQGGGPLTDGPEVATGAIPGPSRQQMERASSLPPGEQETMIQGMVDGLAARLAANPDDANGWIMLMRSRMQLGQSAEAATAYSDAMAAFRGNRTEADRIREAAIALSVPGV